MMLCVCCFIRGDPCAHPQRGKATLHGTTHSFGKRFLFPLNVFLFPLCLIVWKYELIVWKYENCKPRRNNTQKHENCKLSKCNFHISLQFSYQFAILISVCNTHLLRYGFYVDVCNFHISLHFSYQFAILTSQLHHFLMWLCMVPCHYDPTQPVSHARLIETDNFPMFHGGIEDTRRQTTADQRSCNKGHTKSTAATNITSSLLFTAKSALPFPFLAPLTLCCRCHGKIFPFIPCHTHQ